MVLGGGCPERLWCFWKLRGRVQGEGCGEAAQEGRALRPLSGERAPQAGHWSVRAQGRVPREGPPSAPARTAGARGPYPPESRGNNLGLGGPNEPEADKVSGQNIEALPPRVRRSGLRSQVTTAWRTTPSGPATLW